RDVFVFQAEDGIRDFHVTGVQTCALPILPRLPGSCTRSSHRLVPVISSGKGSCGAWAAKYTPWLSCTCDNLRASEVSQLTARPEIGRASCRVRVFERRVVGYAAMPDGTAS